MELVNGLHKAALWLVRPIHMKALKFLTLQAFSCPQSAFMTLSFREEECELMLETSMTFFGPIVTLTYKGWDGNHSRMFDLEDRRSFVIFRNEIMEKLGFANNGKTSEDI